MTTINYSKEFVTTDEAAEILGVSTQTIYKYEKEKKLSSLYDHKWRMRKTKLFKREDVEQLKQSFNKPGLTTGEAAERVGVTPATIHTYIKKDQLPAFIHHYKGKDLYFIKEEDLNEFLSSKEFQLQEKKRERKQFYDKDSGFILYQSLKTVNGQLARILELDGVGKVVTSDGESLTLQQAMERGFEPCTKIADHPYSTKRGYAKFRFIKPHNINSAIYDILEACYQHAGPQNIRLNTEDEYIVMEVKPVSLPFTKERDSSIINLIQNYIIEGKIIYDLDGIFIESDLEPFIIHIPSEMKEFIRKKAASENKSMEELAIEAFRQYWNI
ncbi:helix-turn-helix domain-containing protein [Bacillus sp. BRMEA1]|uniref:helix-turn-helix domain-containing protein n=1 Tax=Neobacillus endophyticus TaxID=2738405 RepID=UPI0015668251|nr:helix-turn-helix domain-containing protein [Neobacillus endophyticus]NRD80969.1 helix-turn-helix domain-containing protein [Neobacillus endophyticus]